MTGDWVRVYSTPDRHLGEIIKGNLEEHGVDCVIINRQDSLYHMLGEVELYVKRNDVLRAIKLIQEANS